jgi:acyl carrier protein
MMDFTMLQSALTSDPDASSDVLAAMAAFFLKTSAAGFTGSITADTPLLGSGLLDSLSMLQLTMHLSDTFGIEFEDDDFTADNFGTAGGLAALVAAKMSRSG